MRLEITDTSGITAIKLTTTLMLSDGIFAVSRDEFNTITIVSLNPSPETIQEILADLQEDAK